MISKKPNFPWDFDEFKHPTTNHKYKIKHQPAWKPRKYPKVFVDKAVEDTQEIPSPDKYNTLIL
jgi:hypothetical protein